MSEALQWSIDFTDQIFLSDPYPWYAEQRRSHPVARTINEDGYEMWHCFRHADVVALLRSSDVYTSGFEPELTRPILEQPDSPLYALARVIENVMLVKDGDDHARLRGLVSKAFTPRMVEALRPRIEGLVDELLQEPLRRGEMDLLSAFAAPLPIIVIAEMLGLPREDRGRLKDWSDRIAPVLDGSIRERGLMEAGAAATELAAYLEAKFAERRADPRDDLISGLVQAHEAGDRLSDDELLATVVLIMGAGHETTTNLIGNGMLALLRHPDQLELLRREPELARGAVDELLRFDSPVQITSRHPRLDMIIGGQPVPAEIEVGVYLGAANRDPAVFADPDVLDLRRKEAGRHVAFGFGPHFCLGASLARLEGEIAFAALAERLRDVVLAEPQLRWREGAVLRGLARLPLRFAAR